MSVDRVTCGDCHQSWINCWRNRCNGTRGTTNPAARVKANTEPIAGSLPRLPDTAYRMAVLDKLGITPTVTA